MVHRFVRRRCKGWSAGGLTLLLLDFACLHVAVDQPSVAVDQLERGKNHELPKAVED
jgi:hypothetical protein